MPSLGEAPSGGARAFCLLLRFSKVSRCKSGTHTRDARSNGYVHQKDRNLRFYGRYAIQQEQAPSPQNVRPPETTSKAPQKNPQPHYRTLKPTTAQSTTH